MPEISLKIAKQHHRYEHIDLAVLVDGVEYKRMRYPRESYRHIMNIDNRDQLLDTIVALLMKQIITDRDIPLAQAQTRADNTSMMI